MKVNMEELLYINKKFNFKIKQIREDAVLVTTGLNEWMIEVTKPNLYNKKHIKLWHKNNRKNKEGWHPQRKFYDLKWTMGHINHHDNTRFRLPYKN
jgi:hypothetical protein